MSVTAPARVALPPGTVIQYLGVEATILRDDGGPSFQVVVSEDGSVEDWEWDYKDAVCERVGLGPDNVLVERKLLECLLAMARTHVEDIESGLEDGTYAQDDNPDLPLKTAVIDVVESLLTAGTTTALEVQNA